MRMVAGWYAGHVEALATELLNKRTQLQSMITKVIDKHGMSFNNNNDPFSAFQSMIATMLEQKKTAMAASKQRVYASMEDYEKQIADAKQQASRMQDKLQNIQNQSRQLQEKYVVVVRSIQSLSSKMVVLEKSEMDLLNAREQVRRLEQSCDVETLKKEYNAMSQSIKTNNTKLMHIASRRKIASGLNALFSELKFKKTALQKLLESYNDVVRTCKQTYSAMFNDVLMVGPETLSSAGVVASTDLNGNKGVDAMLSSVRSEIKQHFDGVVDVIISNSNNISSGSSNVGVSGGGGGSDGVVVNGKQATHKCELQLSNQLIECQSIVQQLEQDYNEMNVKCIDVASKQRASQEKLDSMIAKKTVLWNGFVEQKTASLVSSKMIPVEVSVTLHES
jgi:hypothetical protein